MFCVWDLFQNDFIYLQQQSYLLDIYLYSQNIIGKAK